MTGLRLLLTLAYLGLSWKASEGLDAWLWGATRPPRHLETCSRLMVWCWVLLVVFHGLMGLGLFRPLPALVTWVLLALVSTGVAPGPGERLPPPPSPAEPPPDPRQPPGWIALTLGTALAFLLLLALVRGLLLPTYSWDTMTYHLPLVAHWVQEGGHSYWASPGGWSYYQFFTSNGEALVSWTVLGMGGDDLSGLVLFLPWFLSLYSGRALGLGLGLSPWQAWLASLLVVTGPCYLQALNTGEVDLTLYAFLLVGAAFSQYAEAGPEAQRVPAILLTAAAWGAAAGAKVIALPALVVLAIWGLVLLARGRVGPRVFLLTALVAASTWAPWAIRSTLHSGSPLWPAPLTIGDHTLVPGDPELAATHAAYDRTAEAMMTQPFILDWLAWQYLSPGPRNLGPIMLVAPLLGLLGLLALVRRRPPGLGPMLALVLGELLVFFSPKLWSCRVYFSYSYGRFLGYPTMILLLVGLWGLPRKVREGRLLGGLLLVILATNLLVTSPFGWYDLDAQPAFMVALALLSLAGAWYLRRGAWSRWARLRPTPRGMAPVLFLALLLAPAWREARDRLRIPVLLSEPTFYLEPGARALEILDRPGNHYHLAVTSGVSFFGINQLWAPFMGRRLQNTLRYVPITASGEVVSYWDLGAIRDQVSPRDWMERLYRGGFSHVLCMPPATYEARICRDNSRFFELLTGEDLMKLYRIDRESVRELLGLEFVPSRSHGPDLGNPRSD